MKKLYILITVLFLAGFGMQDMHAQTKNKKKCTKLQRQKLRQQ